jgi:hypothetical protein
MHGVENRKSDMCGRKREYVTRVRSERCESRFVWEKKGRLIGSGDLLYTPKEREPFKSVAGIDLATSLTWSSSISRKWDGRQRQARLWRVKLTPASRGAHGTKENYRGGEPGFLAC